MHLICIWYGLYFLILKQDELVCPPVNVDYGTCYILMDAVIYVHLSLYVNKISFRCEDLYLSI